MRNVRSSVLDAEWFLLLNTAVEGVIAAVDSVTEVIGDNARVIENAHLQQVKYQSINQSIDAFIFNWSIAQFN